MAEFGKTLMSLTAVDDKIKLQHGPVTAAITGEALELVIAGGFYEKFTCVSARAHMNLGETRLEIDELKTNVRGTDMTGTGFFDTLSRKLHLDLHIDI